MSIIKRFRVFLPILIALGLFLLLTTSCYEFRNKNTETSFIYTNKHIDTIYARDLDIKPFAIRGNLVTHPNFSVYEISLWTSNKKHASATNIQVEDKTLYYSNYGINSLRLEYLDTFYIKV